METDIATVPVDLEAPDLVAALASPLPHAEKGPLVRAALARQGATLWDLRDAQRGITRRRITPERQEELDRWLAQVKQDVARHRGTAG